MRLAPHYAPPKHSLLAFVVGAVALSAMVILLTGYNLWRLRAQALDNGIGSAAQYASAFEEHLTQTLSVVDINLIQLGEQEMSDSAGAALLRNAHYLRSVSMTGPDRRIVFSTSPRNVGVVFDDSQLLPQATEPLPLLRVSPLLAGRDLVDARPISRGDAVPPQSLIALQRAVPLGNGRYATMLATLNPDYFVNYYERNLGETIGQVELLRLDGGLLLSTAENFTPGSTFNLAHVHTFDRVEAGQLREAGDDGSPRITAYRVSRDFPLAVVVHLNEDRLLGNWHREVRMTLAIVIPVLVLALATSTVYFLRMRRLAMERSIWIQDLNNQKYALDQHAIVSITDVSGVITYANDRFCAISGYSREELVGHEHRVIKSGFHSPEFFASLWDTIAQGKVWNGEICNRRKNGALYWVNATIVPLMGIDGMVQQYVAIRTDITDRKQIEQSLEDAKNSAEQANSAKSQFLANMSHEIRTPMNAILGLLMMLLRTDLTATQRDYAAKTDHAARSLLGLLNDILDFSKVEAGKMSLSPAPFALDAFFSDLSVVLLNTIGDKPVELLINVSPEVPQWLMADSLRLQQILVNLGSNAIKFTEAGTVTMTVERIAQLGADVTLEFAVTDTGIGIAPENQARIFDGFTQAEATTTRRFGGTGLGLSICRQLVQLMGGTIGLTSTPGRGSRFFFTLTLPVAPSEAVTVAGTSPTAPGNGRQRLKGWRLLVVEDNKINQLVAQTLLAQEGAEVTLAGNGALGVQAVKTAHRPFDAVLMDLQMPVMDGMTAAREIRQLLGDVHLPIVAMTANVLTSDRDACFAAGMDDHIGKPFEINHLVSILARHVHTQPATPPSDTAPTEGTATSTAAADGTLADSPPDSSPGASVASANLDEDTALERLGGNGALYARVLLSFAGDLLTVPNQIAAYLRDNDMERVQHELHTVKGLASTVGAMALAHDAARLEKLVRDGISPEALQPLLTQFRAVVDRHHGLLAEVAGRYQSSTADSDADPGTRMPSLDRARLNQDLQLLMQLLIKSDLLALEVHQHLQRDYATQLGAELRALKSAMDVLDFVMAQEVCQLMMQRLGLNI